MVFILILGFGLLSALLFDILPIVKNSIFIFEIQRLSFSIIQDQKLTDKQKQKLLLTNSGKIFRVTLKLIFFFCVVLLPFAILVKLSSIFSTINIESILISLTGILLSTLAFISYFLLKKIYGKFRI